MKLKPRERECLAQSHTTGTKPIVGKDRTCLQQVPVQGVKVGVELVAGYQIFHPGYATRWCGLLLFLPGRGRQGCWSLLGWTEGREG